MLGKKKGTPQVTCSGASCKNCTRNQLILQIILAVVLGILTILGASGAAGASSMSGTEIAANAAQTSQRTSLQEIRFSGSTRFQVAENVATQEFPTARKAIVVNYLAWADAVSSTNLSQGKYPIFYTAPDAMPASTLAALKRMAPEEIYFVGGPRSISEQVVRAIQSSLPETRTTRIDGNDRYAVSAKTAQMAGLPNTTLVTGHTYSDALIATPYSRARRAATLIVDPKNLPASSRAYLARQTGALYIIGGAVTPAVEAQAESLTRQTAQRITGKDRYAVSANVMTALFPDAASAIVASGETFSDALIGAPLSQKWNVPILLVQKSAIDSTVRTVLKHPGLTQVYLIGGPSTIANGFAARIWQDGNDSATTSPAVSYSRDVYPVVRVSDGDTLVIRIGGTEERVRLIGVDTPESVHPDASRNSMAGVVAANFTKQLLTGKSVALELDVEERDHYGRLLAYVWLDGVMVNRLLLSRGYANAYTYPPNVKYNEEFLRLERQARAAGVGLWGQTELFDLPVPTGGAGSGASGSGAGSGTAGAGSGAAGTVNPIVSPAPSGGCSIKGNINSEGEKIYHIPGGRFYGDTKIDESRGERWFCSESEAVAAGWRKSKR